MQIKVFKANTMKDAMAAMKAELGDDAVILHSKKYKEGGVLGIGSKEVVEITAAVEESSMPTKEPAPRPVSPKPTLFSSAANKYKTSGTAQGVEQAEKEAEILARTASAPRPTLINSETLPNHTLQSDALTAKVAAQNKTPSLVKTPAPSVESETFENVLENTEGSEQPAEVESQSDAEILNSIEETESEEVAKETVEEVQEVVPETKEELTTEENSPETEKVETEESPQEEKVSPPEEIEQSEQETEKVEEEKTSESEKIEQEISVVEETSTEEKPKVEEDLPETEKVEAEESPQEEKVSSPEEIEQQKSAEVQSKSEENSPSVEENVQKQEAPQTNVEQLTPEQIAQAQAMVFAQINQMQMAQVMQQAVAQAQAQAQMQVAEMAEQMREVHRQRLEASGSTPPITSEQSEQDKIQRLEEEIAHMKALLAEVLGKESRQGGLSLHEALRRQEVDEEILTEMATHAGAGDTLLDSKSGGARITLSNYLTEHLRFSDGIKLNRHGVRLVALLGTTGVGKTTTLAKVAAKFVLEHGVNAALITADTYRISAVEQLKTYSDILGLPLEIVYTPTELNSAIEKHKHKELILIDTAGRSQQNIHQMRELEEFLRVNPRIEKHLVISATTKLTDAKDIINKFSAVSPEKIIITKIDETASLGMIINLMRNKKLALSYITTGQSVPDDIELATADILTDLILKKVVV